MTWIDTARFCNSGEDDNTKTPKIVSLIDSFILTHKSIIVHEEWGKEMVLFLTSLTQIWKVNMTHEEFRYCVYNQYDTMYGTFKHLPDKCYEILNERENKEPANRRYSQYEHYYKIKW